MGGSAGGSGSGISPQMQPYDLMGGQYPSFSGGTPSGINWAGVGQDAGQSLSQFRIPQQQVSSMGGTSYFQQSPIQGQYGGPPTYIPQGNMQDIIMRIIGGVY